MRRRATKTTSLFAVVLALCAAVWLWFLAPALRRVWPHAPLPLDDAYIHLDYARSFSLTEPLAWLPGQGYSSGETAPLYAVLLSLPAQLGLDGAALAFMATLSGWLGFGVGAWQWHKLAPKAWLWPLCVTCFGTVLWSLGSGMELGIYFAAFIWTLRSVHLRRLGRISLGLTSLVLLRPESLLLALLLAAGLAGEQPRRVRSFVRLLVPPMLAQLLLFGVNLWQTGETQSAGAILKLVTERPMDDHERLMEVLTNLVTTYFGAFSRSTVAPGLLIGLWCALVLVACWPGRRRTSFALLAAIPMLALLVSLNHTARFQGFRYYVPALLCGFALAGLGLVRLARRAPLFACTLQLTFIGLCAPKLPAFRDHFTRAAGNIREQQVEVGLRLAELTPPDARIMVGDAGAIPYFSKRVSLDALGLGGYHGVPFVRAATVGEAATLELIEGLPPERRPTHLAIYASWFPETAARFGREWFSVSVDDNAILGAPTKTIYVADWSAMGEFVPEAFASRWEPPRLLDQLDFADLPSEHAHRLESHAPSALRVFVLEEDGAPRFDGCRALLPGQRLSFRLRAPSQQAPSWPDTTLGLRGTDLTTLSAQVTMLAIEGRKTIEIDSYELRWQVDAPQPERWQLATLGLRPSKGSQQIQLTLQAEEPAWLCHLWWRALE